MSANLDDPAQIKGDLLAVITNAIVNHPRSLQKRIGPSGVDDPCARRVGYTLAGAPDLNPFADVPWLPTIGTGVHGWLEDQFGSDPRYLTEQRVSVGEIGGVDITGSADLFDLGRGVVIDWKIVGPTTLKKYKRHGPGRQYRGQAHLYGRGFRRAGYHVTRVMVAFLPRNAELHEAYFWSEPYDEQIALDALARANAINTMVTSMGAAAALPLLPTAEAYCSRCDFFKRGSTDLMTGCPGDPASQVETQPALTFGGAQ